MLNFLESHWSTGVKIKSTLLPSFLPPSSLLFPPGGNYFSMHYHLGHKKFQSAEPEVFLFGELSDINFLGSKPAPVRISRPGWLCFAIRSHNFSLSSVQFPYKQPTKSQPIKCLRSFINLQRDSIKLVK